MDCRDSTGRKCGHCSACRSNELNDVWKERNALAQQLEQARKNYDQARTEVVAVREQLAESERRVAEFKKIANDVAVERDAANMKLGVAEKKLEGVEWQLKEAREDLSKHLDEKAELRNERTKLKELVDASHKEAYEDEQTITRLREHAEKVEREKADLGRENTALRERERTTVDRLSETFTREIAEVRRERRKVFDGVLAGALLAFVAQYLFCVWNKHEVVVTTPPQVEQQKPIKRWL